MPISERNILKNISSVGEKKSLEESIISNPVMLMNLQEDLFGVWWVVVVLGH